MIATILAFGILGQNSNTEPAKYPSKLAAPYAAAIDKLAGHGFAGSEVIIELDWKDPRRWKAALWVHSVFDGAVPIAEQVVGPDGPEFKFTSIGNQISNGLGVGGRTADRRAWDLAKMALPKAVYLDQYRTFFVVGARNGIDLSDHILENKVVDFSSGAYLAIGSKGHVMSFIPIGPDGSVTNVLRACLGLSQIPEFGTPGFPKSE